MNGRQAYEIWVDNNAQWTQWSRPVPFVACNTNASCDLPSLHLPNISYTHWLSPKTAVVVDLPDCESIEEGLALAKLGVRPIPLFNGTNAPHATVSIVFNSNIQNALLLGAQHLKDIKLLHTAPPAFLLDSNRLQRFKMNVSVFDNSWDIYPQDMPTANFLLDHAIENVLVRSEKINDDLNVILFKYQQAGIKILLCNQLQAESITLKKPSRRRLKLL